MNPADAQPMGGNVQGVGNLTTLSGYVEVRAGRCQRRIKVAKQFTTCAKTTKTKTWQHKSLMQ